MRRLIPLVLALAALAGCAVGPDYHRPELSAPAKHRDAPPAPSADSLASVADLPWFQVFRDSTLRSLVGEALVGNQDLRMAAARVEQARAQAGVAGAPLWPQIGLAADGSRQQVSKEAFPTAEGRTVNLFDLGAGASWELDLFGRIRRQKESAVAQAFAAEWDRRGVMMSLVSEVAFEYFSLRELDARLQIARSTLQTRQGTLDLFTRRYRGGVASRLETTQAEADLRATAAAIPDLERQIALQENSINVLLGRNPGPIARPEWLPDWSTPPAIPAGLPSQLLERRPDVRAAEERLRSANAQVGAAVALYFPTVNLSGFIGGQSRELSNLTTPDAAIWSVTGGIFAPLFQGGRIRNLNKSARAEYEMATAQYVKSAQVSFQEAANALVSTQKLQLVTAEYEKRVAALQEGTRLSLLRYNGGLASYLEVLDADRQLFEAANTLARSRGDLARSYVQIYRALGGGWQTAEPAAGGR